MSDPHHHTTADDPPTLHDVDKPAAITAVWVVVLGLAAVNIGLSMAHLGRLALPVQLGIGAVQAFLVAHYWMHMRRKDNGVMLSALSALFFMAILFVLVFADYFSRTLAPTFQGDSNVTIRGR